MFDFRRTYDCRTLNKLHIGEKVTLSGWVNKRRDHGGLIFIDLRDRFGLTQLVFDPKLSLSIHEKASEIRNEWVISIHGKVIPRAEGMVNPKLSTGEIEVQVEELEILSKALTPPFSICDSTIDVNEETRLKYRYLDIRRGDVSSKLVMRHKLMLAVRNFMDSQNFLEITTPILCKSTPEGARDYLVASRVYPGNFYALPQSPQIFKQLLMISGMDRYFQIAQCFRDEDLRADRQPEFTQIDIEMSFNTPEGLFEICENLMQHIFQTCLGIDIGAPFPHMSHKEALEKYGTDKPDVRFDMPLVRLDDIVQKSTFSVLLEELKNEGVVKALCVKNGAEISRKQIEEYESVVGKFGIKGLAWMKKSPEGFTSSIVKFFSEDLLKEIENRMNVENNDLILIAAGPQDRVNQGLDHLRRHIARQRNLIKENVFEFLWVMDFPMFTIDKETNDITAEHHPFTSPNFEDMHLLDKDPLKVRALAYDLVLNGYELASGSQRIHDSALQAKIFKLLKFSDEDLKAKFGFFIDALKYGTPPHLGCALGLDRIVMILTKTENIRDVIAFPKTQKASDVMLQAPSPATSQQLKELKLKAEPEKIAWP
ncbi:MAG: aspartate--tRNA ligase [Chlamydiae bacterium]|nr:aspartate--tRNA ligase [Chlamydiota bacterium]